LLPDDFGIGQELAHFFEALGEVLKFVKNGCFQRSLPVR
jgi:hypothetical protein